MSKPCIVTSSSFPSEHTLSVEEQQEYETLQRVYLQPRIRQGEHAELPGNGMRLRRQIRPARIEAPQYDRLKKKLDLLWKRQDHVGRFRLLCLLRENEIHRCRCLQYEYDLLPRSKSETDETNEVSEVLEVEGSDDEKLCVCTSSERTLSVDEQQEEYATLQRVYLQKRVGQEKIFRNGIRLRRQIRPARVEAPQYKALKQKLDLLEERQDHAERFRLLCMLREHEVHKCGCLERDLRTKNKSESNETKKVSDVIEIDDSEDESSDGLEVIETEESEETNEGSEVTEIENTEKSSDEGLEAMEVEDSKETNEGSEVIGMEDSEETNEGSEATEMEDLGEINAGAEVIMIDANKENDPSSNGIEMEDTEGPDEASEVIEIGASKENNPGSEIIEIEGSKGPDEASEVIIIDTRKETNAGSDVIELECSKGPDEAPEAIVIDTRKENNPGSEVIEIEGSKGPDEPSEGIMIDANKETNAGSDVIELECSEGPDEAPEVIVIDTRKEKTSGSEVIEIEGSKGPDEPSEGIMIDANKETNAGSDVIELECSKGPDEASEVIMIDARKETNVGPDVIEIEGSEGHDKGSDVIAIEDGKETNSGSEVIVIEGNEETNEASEVIVIEDGKETSEVIETEGSEEGDAGSDVIMIEASKATNEASEITETEDRDDEKVDNSKFIDLGLITNPQQKDTEKTQLGLLSKNYGEANEKSIMDLSPMVLSEHEKEIVFKQFQQDYRTMSILKGNNIALEEVLDEYLCFMKIKTMDKRQTESYFPSPLVKSLWHAHILCTFEYAAFCDKWNGSFIHHSSSMKNMHESYKNTLESYERLFMGKTRHPLIWPSGWSVLEIDETMDEKNAAISEVMECDKFSEKQSVVTVETSAEKDGIYIELPDSSTMNPSAAVASNGMSRNESGDNNVPSVQPTPEEASIIEIDVNDTDSDDSDDDDGALDLLVASLRYKRSSPICSKYF